MVTVFKLASELKAVSSGRQDLPMSWLPGIAGEGTSPVALADQETPV